jgi:predicted cupin superfamily sugar epimerase
MSTRTAEYWISRLQLATHIEGGAFREIYRSPVIAPATALPGEFTSDRSFCTSIYFLLQQHQFSAFHKIKSDEVWHFYYGDALIVYEIDQEGRLIEHRLGYDPDNNETFQCVIPAGNWFAARLVPGGDYSLVGCTVSPGFDFADFELAKQNELIAAYPDHSPLIKELTIQ